MLASRLQFKRELTVDRTNEEAACVLRHSWRIVKYGVLAAAIVFIAPPADDVATFHATV